VGLGIILGIPSGFLVGIGISMGIEIESALEPWFNPG